MQKGNNENAVTVLLQFVINENGDIVAPKIRKSPAYQNNKRA